jgi:hypothetical protein
MLQFSDEEIESVHRGEAFPVEEMKDRIRQAIRKAYEFPVWVHFKADPNLLRKSAKEIIDGDPILSFNLDTMAEEAIASLRSLKIREEDKWWRKED